MADSLKQRHLQRELPEIVGTLSTDALNTLVRLFSNATDSYVNDYSAICYQIIANFYATGILPSKEIITEGNYLTFSVSISLLQYSIRIHFIQQTFFHDFSDYQIHIR